jgi:hypothetical protein
LGRRRCSRCIGFRGGQGWVSTLAYVHIREFVQRLSFVSIGAYTCGQLVFVRSLALRGRNGRGGRVRRNGRTCSFGFSLSGWEDDGEVAGGRQGGRR